MSHSAIQLRAMRAMSEGWHQTVFTPEEVVALMWFHAQVLLTP